jgi:hypothetical protein
VWHRVTAPLRQANLRAADPKVSNLRGLWIAVRVSRGSAVEMGRRALWRVPYESRLAAPLRPWRRERLQGSSTPATRSFDVSRSIPRMSWRLARFRCTPTGLSTSISGEFLGGLSNLRYVHCAGEARRQPLATLDKLAISADLVCRAQGCPTAALCSRLLSRSMCWRPVLPFGVVYRSFPA